MDDIGRYIWTAAGFVLLVLIAMFFSAAATAVASLSGSTLKRLAEEEEDEVVEFLLRGEGEDQRLVPLEDETLMDEVFAEFCHQYEEYEDSDDAMRLER